MQNPVIFTVTGLWESREAYAAALMEDGLGASKDRPAALIHFVENMAEEEVAALRKALRTMGRQAKP